MEQKTSTDDTNEIKFFDERQTLIWRIAHGTFCFMLGGLCFIAGSCMYFTTVYDPYPAALIAGGWLFTIGSVLFLLADLLEWSHYLRECCFCCLHRDEYENSNAGAFKYPRSSLLGHWQRSEVGINVFVSVCGSILYLIGSIFFIPALSDYVIAGDWLFIVGSAFIFSSQGWKVYRMSRTNVADRTDHRFRLANLANNISVVFADVFTGFGGVFFFIGTILFLPRFNISDADENRAAIIFVLGSVSFTIGSFFVHYIYYCRYNR
ncbi:unnamed protein product [Rotaria socialis]|uniref:YrhK domain-containing protein n=1 Tax=Rotaria socialis TaxID=392032 RepID=A0A818HKU5_9BILA|nr:unnamed protein product [Rotaria socialis]CAF3361538.1 unnamed protein product [Rotaria socialis]CAF3505848.1 unnamed protein product [Rotaria socialis]CAF3626132.1 unnamed protein product [Rotaria socialis]CAF4193972.1 unnamed protein product [Rotaria socialis]